MRLFHLVMHLDNYRAITLLLVISKVFEMVLLAVCEPVLESDPLQFGFKHVTQGVMMQFFPLSQLSDILMIVVALCLSSFI